MLRTFYHLSAGLNIFNSHLQIHTNIPLWLLVSDFFLQGDDMKWSQTNFLVSISNYQIETSFIIDTVLYEALEPLEPMEPVI